MKNLMKMASLVALLFAVGCASPKNPFNPFDPEGVRRRMTDLVNRNKFQEAREIKVKGYADAVGRKSPEELMKERLIETLVNPAEARFTVLRIQSMKAQVIEALERNDDEAAREIVYKLGITDQRVVNTVVYISKCHELNTRVNPATLAKWERFAKQYVDGSLKAGDFKKALAAAKRIQPVAAYPARIDEMLDESGAAAVEQHAEKDGVASLGWSTKAYLYKKIATREGGEKEPLDKIADDLRTRTKDMMPEEGFEPDWTLVEIRLQSLKQALLADDVDEREADGIVKTLLEAYQSLVAEEKGLTTYELNRTLSALREESLYRVSNAIEAAVRTADAARAAELRKLAAAAAAMIAEEVDSADRERAMLAAISDRAEPGINRVLGEGCRVLRLYRLNGKVSPAQATSLFVAAVYMGFDDLMDLALALGADINGASEKDTLGRTAYLVALQYGFKGKAKELLAAADVSRRDANGCGAVHYAVRGGDAKTLLSLLQRGLDAKGAATDGTTPLILAVARGNGTMARMLVPLSDIDAADSTGWTALHHAAKGGALDIVKSLAGVGSATDRKTAEGDTVLSLAVQSNSEDLLKYLLDDLKLPVDERAVSRCVIEGWLWPLKMLVAHGGELTDKHLAAAVKCGHLETVKWLIERGCDVNADIVHAVGAGTGEMAAYLHSQGYRN